MFNSLNNAFKNYNIKKITNNRSTSNYDRFLFFFFKSNFHYWFGNFCLNIVKYNSKPPKGVSITRMGDGFGRLMAEYVVGNILSRELSVVKFSQQQQNNMWDKRYAPPPKKKYQ